MAQFPHDRWDRVDEDLRNRHLRTTRPFCLNCLNFGHMAPECPAAAKHNRNTDQNSRNYASASRQPSRSRESRRNVCFNFNDFGQCDRKNCHFAHVCSVCGLGHSVLVCPSVKNT